MHISDGNRDPPRRTRDRRDYFPPTVTLLPAPLTDTRALVGLAYFMVPRLGFFTAPSVMETLVAVAPFRRATGIPPNSAQEPPQRLFETESRLPPVPPKATRAPPMLAKDPPPTLSSGPFRSDSVLPLLRVSRLPVTVSPLPPVTFTRAPRETMSRLASRATRVVPWLVSRLCPLNAIASEALVSWLPRRRATTGAVASRRALSTRATCWVVIVAPSAASSPPPVVSGVSVATVCPVRGSTAVPLPARSKIAMSVPMAWLPPVRETRGSVVVETKLPPGSTESKLTGAVRLVSVARSSGPARLAFDPAATTIAESKVAAPP